jgi:O-antigen biosynthesis protein
MTSPAMTPFRQRVQNILSRAFPPLSVRRNLAERVLCRFRKFRNLLACLIAIHAGVSGAERDRAIAAILGFRYRPTVSILLVVPPPLTALPDTALSSVLSQVYPDWQLCIAASPGAVPGIRSLLDRLKVPEQNFRLIPVRDTGDAAAGASAAFASVSGEYFMALDPGDMPDPRALYELVRALQEEPAPDIVYSDEAVTGRAGIPSSIRRKPGFSPDLLLSAPFCGRMLAFRTGAVRDTGGIRDSAGPSWEYDLVLRLASRGGRAARLPHVLYYSCCRPSGPDQPCGDGGDDPFLRVLNEHLAREHIDAAAGQAAHPGTFRVKRRIAGEPLVSLVIPTKDRVDLLSPCIESIVNRSTYPRYEILVIDNQSRDPATRDYFSRIAREHDNLRIIPYNLPFHPSAIKNAAAREARGEYLLFLNNDIEVISPGWIEALLEQAQRDEVACAGAKLLYPGGTIQHAGVVMGSGGVVDHIFRFAPGNGPESPWELSCIRNFRMLTGACMLIKKTKLEELGGFDEGYRAGFGDLDLCMRAYARGYLNVCTPFAELYHHESASLADSPAASFHTGDQARFFSRWRAELEQGDPYYHPGLPYNDFCLKFV